MVFTDFRVRYDPKTDTIQDVTDRILYSLFIRRTKFKKPAVVFVSGDSGEGKSVSTIGIQYALMRMKELSLSEYMNDINVYTPFEYPEKIDALLHDKRLKKINMICVHEARELVRAKNWQRFLTQAIGDVNAESRSIKPLIFFIISQFIRDITTDIRYTLNYYIKVNRPMGKSYARMQIFVMWKDDRDLEKPKLRKRRVSGYLVYPSGKHRRFIPPYLEMYLPPKDIVERFNVNDVAAKKGLIRGKLDKLLAEMKKEFVKESDKLNLIANYYTSNQDLLNTVGRRYKGGFKFKTEIIDMHNLSKNESKKLEKIMIKKVEEIQKKKGDILE